MITLIRNHSCIILFEVMLRKYIVDRWYEKKFVEYKGLKAGNNFKNTHIQTHAHTKKHPAGQNISSTLLSGNPAGRSFRNTLPQHFRVISVGKDSENTASSDSLDDYIVKYTRRRNYGTVEEHGWPQAEFYGRLIKLRTNYRLANY